MFVYCNDHTRYINCISDGSFAFIQGNITHMKAKNKPIKRCFNFYLVETNVTEQNNKHLHLTCPSLFYLTACCVHLELLF